jgi:hypothetical protein
MSWRVDHEARLSRRRLLQTGGLAAAVGVVLAACGKDEEADPGRVGYAPPATPLPTLEKNDAVWLRTAMSLEYTTLEVYRRMTEMGVLDADAQTLVDRFVADHTAHIAVLGPLIADAGGEPYECVNSWYVERTVDPIFTQITGDESEDIAPSDDPARDLMTVSNGWESMIGATYQQMVEMLTKPELRGQAMAIGVEEARQAAAMAMLATGTPEGYVSPLLFGEAPTPDETGLFKAFAIPTRFGSLAAIEVVVGARSEAGTRAPFTLETPADNSLIYEGMTCPREPG